MYEHLHCLHRLPFKTLKTKRLMLTVLVYYALKKLLLFLLSCRSQSSSPSSNSEPEGQVEFITEFGEQSDSEPANKVPVAPTHVSPMTTKSKTSGSSREDRKRKRSRSKDRYESSRSKRRAQRSPSPRSHRRRSRSR